MNNLAWAPSWLRQFGTYAVGTSKPYRVVMLLLFGLHFILTWAAMQSLLAGTGEYVNAVIARALLEATLFIAVCHFLVRPYLRMNLVGTNLQATSITLCVFYLMAVSIVYFYISYSLGKLDFLTATDMSQIQVQSGQMGRELGFIAMVVMGSAQSLITLSLWSVAYLVWHFQKNKRELQHQINQSQIQQLTNQLSPHFLFNSLNSIRALIFADQERAAEVLTLLSDLLRSQMHSQLKTRSTLGEEWQLTGKYLEIEKVRFDERLTLEVDLAPATLGQEVPTLTLLTLAENAVKHGISQSSRPGYIRLTSYLSASHSWCLEVANSHFNSTGQPGTQVGQHNVKKRLELVYGHQSRFTTEDDNQQYRVLMELPYVKSPDS